MKILIFIFLFFGFSQQYSNTITNQENTQTKVTFKVKNMGIFVDGTFTKVKLESNFNENDLNSSFFKVIIQINSLDTDNSKRDKDLKKSKYFDADKFPTMKFISTKIEKQSNNTYQLEGNLTIKDVIKKIVFPVEITANSSLKANFEINRLDYKVGGKSWVMSDTVIIEVHFKI